MIMQQNYNNTLDKYFNKKFLIAIGFIFTITIIGCDKDDDGSNLKADFSIELIDDNNALFINQSKGDYNYVVWDFGNDMGDTTSTVNTTYEIYYPFAGSYNVSLTINNYDGSTSTETKELQIATDDGGSIIVSFTATVNPDNPNEVELVNTTEGEYDSFEWHYNNSSVLNEMEHEAYFPLAGIYNIGLNVFKGGNKFSKSESVNISQNDPDLIWSDEFNYSGLPNSQYWNMEIGGSGWGNNELQYYTNNTNNAMVNNGLLTITALKESYGGRQYTSARITTQNKFTFKYGRVEARIKLPYGQGIWPAFWMLGANFSSVGWPTCGEVDIMEMVGGTGKDNRVYSTLHWDNGGHQEYGSSYSLSPGIFADDFHVFSIEWDENKIRSYVDGNPFFVIDITPAFLSEFHQNFFLIMNVAVGGNWPGSPNASTVFPQTMQVDYVRVYQGSK
jgi:beta-glucanase (GH16 family)